MRRSAWLIAAAIALALPCSAQAAFPGQNGRIAFSSSVDGDSEIYTINPDGTGLAQLTDNTIADVSPSWSPDGQRIVFLRADGPDLDIWKMNADGDGEALVLDYPGAPGFAPNAPAWSPDGGKIVFGVNDSDNRGLCTADFDDDVCALFTVNPDGTALEMLVQTISDACCPSWSPDGSRVAFSSGEPGLEGVYTVVVKTIGGGTATIATGPDIEDSNIDPDWSPGQETIDHAYQPAGGGSSNVQAMNPDGTGKVQGHEGRQPVFSPDGSKIAFFSNGPPAGVWVGEAPLGSGATFLASGGAPDWQPIPVTSYPRPKGATPSRAALTIAYRPCSAPNRTHGPPLAFGSCSPPQMASDYLTVGTGDSNGKPARSDGHVILQTIVGNPTTPADEADVAMGFSISDVYTKAMVDYDGELRVRITLQITDKDNTPNPGGPGATTGSAATTTEIPIEMVAPCSPTINLPDEGSYCSVSTTPDTLVPGSVKESRRTIWQVGSIEVYDGGADGDAGTPAGDTLFATQGLFIP